MKHSHFISHFFAKFGVRTFLFIMMSVLLASVQVRASYAFEGTRSGSKYLSDANDLTPISDTEEEEKAKSKLPSEHIDGSVICIPGTVLVIPDTDVSTGDTFHHKTKVLSAPDLVKELMPVDTAFRESRFDPTKQPKFTAFEDRQNFKHFLRYKDFDGSVKALGYRNLPELDDDSRSMFTDDDDDPDVPSEKFHWRPAILQSLMMQGVQHGYALAAQEKTRRALKGPFFKDYWRSLKGLSGWDDGNRFFTNYIAHPMQGAMTGFIYAQNHDRVKKQTFAESPEYWRDRLKIFVWSTAWSTNWELGPISQSSIGNLGMYGGMAYVDLVITPTVGTTWMMTEEALDRYVIRHIESKSFFVKVMTRMFLNPMRTTANLMRFKHPWYRDRPFHY